MRLPLLFGNLARLARVSVENLVDSGDGVWKIGGVYAYGVRIAGWVSVNSLHINDLHWNDCNWQAGDLRECASDRDFRGFHSS